jgi:hypothetical protein
MRTSIMRKYFLYFVALEWAGPLVAGFVGMNALLYFQTSWQAYRLRKITTAAAQGILEPVGGLLKELQSSEGDGNLPDFEFEARNDSVGLPITRSSRHVFVGMLSAYVGG